MKDISWSSSQCASNVCCDAAGSNPRRAYNGSSTGLVVAHEAMGVADPVVELCDVLKGVWEVLAVAICLKD